MYVSAVVADTKLHAEAMIRWLQLDPELWVPVVYGQNVATFYNHARIIRPASGVTEAHRIWLVDYLLPRIARQRTTLPPCWEPIGSQDSQSALGFSSMWV